jgi:dUTP pyrophosphatase
MSLKVKIKKLVPEAEIPRYSRNGYTGLQLIATSKVFDSYGALTFGTGLSISIPSGYIGVVFPLNNISKKDLMLSSSLGIIYPDDNREIVLKFKPVSFFAEDDVRMEIGIDSNTFDYVSVGKEYTEDTFEMSLYNVGDKIGHLLIFPVPNIEWEEVIDVSIGENTNISSG